MPVVLVLLSFVAVAAALLAGALIFGGPGFPSSFPERRAAPFHDGGAAPAPPLSRYRGDGGTGLALRAYPPAGRGGARGAVILLHGVLACSETMHPLAQALAAAGFAVYAPDIRGHGASGERGHIDYVGQLEADVAALLDAVRPPQPLTLAGYSAGGGLALRVAAGPLGSRFQSFMFLAPFLGPDAPTSMPAAGGGAWLRIGWPRLLALMLLNRSGVRRFNRLPVARFAVAPAGRGRFADSFDYSLAMNFGPPRDWRGAIAAIRRPFAVIAGADDDCFRAGGYAEAFAGAPFLRQLELAPGVDHASLPAAPEPVAMTVAAIARLQQERT